VRHEDPDEENFIAINVYLLYTVLANCGAPLYFDRVVPDTKRSRQSSQGRGSGPSAYYPGAELSLARDLTCHRYEGVVRAATDVNLAFDTSESLLSGWHVDISHVP